MSVLDEALEDGAAEALEAQPEDGVGSVEVAEPKLRAERSAQDSARKRRIEVTAYYRAQARGFVPGYELDDWLAAEEQITGKPEMAVGPRDDNSGADKE